MLFIQTGVSLLHHNTFGIDAVASSFVQFKTYAEIAEIAQYVQTENRSWWPLGQGSNIIFTGKFSGVIIQCTANSIAYQGGLVVADAGADWDTLVGWCVERGYAGLENLSYIPSSVGATPVQNIGAYGAEAGDSIEWVEYFDFETHKICKIDGAHCKFGYRDSIFKNELKNRAFVLRVAYRVNEQFSPSAAKLDYGDLRARVEAAGGVTIENIRTSVIEIRRSKLPEPKIEPNAGSFFTNPVVAKDIADKIRQMYPDITLYPTVSGKVKIPAGALIDRAGWKGKRIGKVGVHPRQALVIVNYDHGNADDILALANAIKSDIHTKFGIELQMEVNVL